ncbi:MAG: glucosaminidase domain-containing protein [Rikenellaceae bacterium]
MTLISQTSLAANSNQRISREEYIARYKHIAIEHQRYYGIPASITMAQGILESDSGNSYLAKGSNNHFGIKCKSNWTGRTFTHTDDAPDECFRAYDSVEASYEDHAEFLDSSPRYDSLFRFDPTDYRSWARGLKGAGYATAPDYTARLVKLIEDNNLYMLDIEAEGGVVPESTQIVVDVKPAPHNEVTKVVGNAVDPNNFHVSIDTYNGYNIYRTNHTCYTTAKRGDTTKSIAQSFDLSEKKIRKYNDLKDGEKIKGGDIIFIERKQSRWLGNVAKHHLLKGETLHSISQRYAIRESSLRRMNRVKGGAEPNVGTDIKIK